MKKAILYFALISFTVACNSNSSLTVDNYETPQTHQELKKTYGAGGKIIYGTSEGSQNETSSPTYNSEENYDLYTNSNEIIVPKKNKENNQVKTSKKKGFDFKTLKIRPFSKKTKKAKAPQSEGGGKGDHFAVLGFVFSLVGPLAIIIGAVFGYAGIDLIFLILIFGGIALLILALIFSIAGLKSQRKKGFAIAGLIISGVFISLVALLLLTWAI